MPEKHEDFEKIQQMAAKIVATYPAGHNLLLIGGFRYRLLDHSARLSHDIDYHWAGDLTQKQQELVKLFRRVLLPQVRRQPGYAGNAGPARGPQADSPQARFVDLAFWKPEIPDSRIEIPVEITRVICLDSPTIRTASGVVYPTLSEADMIEGKILAILNRVHLAHRDLVDLFLYGDRLLPDSPQRLKEKLQQLEANPVSLRLRLQELADHAEYHARAVQIIIDAQLDAAVAANIASGGGAPAVFRRALELLRANLPSLHENY